MSIFIPPLSLSKYAEFVQDSSSSTGYDTFQAEADGTPIERQYWEEKIAPMLYNIANLAKSSTELMKRAWQEASLETLGLRDDKNYLGFRMAMRISKSIKVNSIGSSNSLEINIETSTNPLVVWKEDIAAQPRLINSSNEFDNEIFNQDQLGDFFILRYFIHHWKWFTDSERVAFTSNAFNIWNAIQIPLAEVVFSAKSKNKGFLRPCELDAKKYPIKHGLKIPPHNTFPSGHAAGPAPWRGYCIFWRYPPERVRPLERSLSKPHIGLGFCVNMPICIGRKIHRSDLWWV
ncbi:hypothetical protein [Ideonella paludis]|uniref:hypothetical protein n=1 Tax=Ideonella paludis TaxID=1233411 RepID=UPI00363D9483